jgi:hypothetical protein
MGNLVADRFVLNWRIQGKSRFHVPSALETRFGDGVLVDSC